MSRNTPVEVYFSAVINHVGAVNFVTYVNVGGGVEGVREAVGIEDIEMGEVDVDVEMGDVDEDIDMGADENHLFG
jgi:hypothetical protein